jgi:endoglucanase
MLFMKLFFLLVFFLICNNPSLKAQDSVNTIRLDQEGFYPNAAKTAIVVKAFGQNSINLPAQTLFYIIREENGRDTVFRGRLSLPLQSTNSSLQTSIADFSELTKTELSVFPFPDAACPMPSIYRKMYIIRQRGLLKAFYYQRASTELKPAFAGKWSRASGHPDDSVIIHPSAASPGRKSGSVIATPGGWYDAGDYNKYIVNSGITMGTLLSAFENFKTYFDTLHTNIPASRRSIPDLLNEILYNLRWMLSMQDPQDGGVYNKCTNAALIRWSCQLKHASRVMWCRKGTAATRSGAVAAQASRIFALYKNELPGFGDSCLRVAEKAWAWAQQHPDLATRMP